MLFSCNAMKSSGRSCCQILGKLRCVVVQQARAQSLRLAVNDAEHLHLVLLGEANKTHERQRSIGKSPKWPSRC